jgi:hypothetical protein
MFVLIIVGLATLYPHGPSRRLAKWRWISLAASSPHRLGSSLLAAFLVSRQFLTRDDKALHSAVGDPERFGFSASRRVFQGNTLWRARRNAIHQGFPARIVLRRAHVF